jgi:hypothetical protein
MSRHLATCLVIAALAVVSSGPAIAAQGDVIAYDTVDGIEASGSTVIVITGVVVGQGASTTIRYGISISGASDYLARCEKFAMLAMSKPGKFQFAVVQADSFGDRFNCRLIARTP